MQSRKAKPAVPVMVRLNPDVHMWIKNEADRIDRSANWVINNLLTQASLAKALAEPLHVYGAKPSSSAGDSGRLDAGSAP